MTMESSGPDGKVRGTAQQVYDKYLALARDALSSGDRVAAETYSQYADHYYRILQVNREEMQHHQDQQQQHGGQGGQGGYDENRQQGQNPGQGGNGGQHHDQPYHNEQRENRGVPVAEMQAQYDDDERQPEGLDNASNDPARTTTH
jgi:hypothetical protein